MIRLSRPSVSARRVRDTAVSMLALVATLAGGCTSLSTSDVESGLQRMRFYPNMYVVQAGDTLDTVAFRYRLDRQELVSLNPGIDANLRPGMRINVRPGTELAEDVRAAARVARGPEVLTEGPGASAALTAANRPATAANGVVASGTTIVATAPAAPQAVRVAPVAPSRTGEVVIEEAAFDAVTGGHPNEQVVVDDLDPWSAAAARMTVPDSGYVPVPTVQTATGPQWVWPTVGEIARGFAPERVGGQGIDIAGLPGQDVRAAAAGTVIYSGKDPSGGGGGLVILDHGDELMTTYSHADKLFVVEDDVVEAGDPIASLGANAQAETVLSFEVRRDGSPMDPLQFIGSR